jgi:hypothetical protein
MIGLLSAVVALLAAPARAAIVPWIDLDEMSRRAEVIALGRVDRIDSSWSEDGRIILTRATVVVERALKGGPRKRVTVEVPGGKVGEQIMIASGAPTFSEGERVVLFLSRPGNGTGRRGPDAAASFAVVGWNLGKLRVRHDGRTGRDLVHDPGGGAVTYLGPDGRAVDPRRRGRVPVELQQFLRRVEDLLAPANEEHHP